MPSVPIFIPQEAPRRTITEHGIIYREVSAGDNFSGRHAGFIILFITLWVALISWAIFRHLEDKIPGWMVVAAIIGPILLGALFLIIKG